MNCVGIMGRGIALQFRKEFPENYEVYQAACRPARIQPGMMLVFNLNRLQSPRYIINFPTKRHWKGNSRIEDIRVGLDRWSKRSAGGALRPLPYPRLAAAWAASTGDQVRPIDRGGISRVAGCPVLVYEPAGASAAGAHGQTKKAPKYDARAGRLLGLMRRYLAAVMDPFVSLLEIHKLMYFMQEAGERLRLRFTKGHYGPYAENLRHVLSHIEGHFISGYGDAEDDPEKQIELNVEASEQSRESSCKATRRPKPVSIALLS